MFSRRNDLQLGECPRQAQVTENPERLLEKSKYQRADASGAAGAMPSETFQYDIVYDTFKSDEEFKKHWCVVDCARNSPLESISQDNASIRVVMKLDSNQKLCPTAYTPGFPTVPFRTDRARNAEPRKEKQIPGLPPGYSVALDVYILSDARVMLQHQRDFRNGKIDEKYEWLQKIVEKEDEKERASGTAPSASRALARVHDAGKAELVSEKDRKRPEAKLRPPIGGLPMDCSEAGACESLEPYSDLYGERARVTKHVGLGWKQVYAENTLVSAFDDSTLGLPSRGEHSTWATTKRRTPADDQRERELEDRQEDELMRILERTTASLDR